MTTNPSDTGDSPVGDTLEVAEANPLDEYAASVGTAVGAWSHSADHGTVKVVVEPSSWVSSLTTARDDLGLIFFSWLSAVDWANDVVVGDPPAEPVEERYEILCAVGDLSEGRLVIFSATLSKDSPTIDSLVDVYSGASWHEREAHEMFGIDFDGHPDLSPLYLPDSFMGHPLRKDYPLLSRTVKPWPGKVDVEDMPPSTENPGA